MAVFTLISATRGFARKADTEAGKIGLEMDAVIEEAPEFAATVTTNPVERGADVTDHVALKPLTLSVSAIVTNTPVSLLKIAKGATFSDPAGSAWSYIKQLFKEAIPFDFVGGYETYKDMVIVQLSAPRKSSTANALVFQCKMQQVNLAETKEVTLAKVTKKRADTAPKAAPASDLGFQPAGVAQGVEPTAGVATGTGALTKTARDFFAGGGSYPMPQGVGVATATLGP